MGKKENQSTDLRRGRRIAVKGAGASTQTMCDKVFGLETAGWGEGTGQVIFCMYVCIHVYIREGLVYCSVDMVVVLDRE
jgi:hypothetical protein